MKLKKINWGAGIVAVVATVALLSGCTTSTPAPSGSAATGTAGALDCTGLSTVTLGIQPTGSVVPNDILAALHTFDKVQKDCGTKVNITTFETPAPMVAALQAGQIQFMIPTSPIGLQTATQGTNLTAVLALTMGAGGMVVQSAKFKAAGTGLNALKKLPAGTKWALSNGGGSAEMYARAFVNAAGGNDKTQVNVLSVGITGIVPAISSGQGSFAVMPYALAAPMLQDGRAVAVLNTSGQSAFDKFGFIPGYTLYTTPDFAKQHAGIAAHVAAAELTGLLYVQAHADDPAAIYKLMPASYRSSTTLDAWTLAWKYGISAMTVSGLVDKSDFVRVGEMMHKNNILPAYTSSTVADSAVNKQVLDEAFRLVGKPVPTEKVNKDLFAKYGGK